ncbi:MAG: hypothetical protein JRK53_27940, partial [Deltaproteobacteria bacterium]|nr:hypothetical protein [Deltaproteobacteria bacterium]
MAAIVSVFFTLPFFFCAEAPAGTSARVLIIPFNINADRDLSFLQRGAMDMLRTRLAQAGNVDVMLKTRLVQTGNVDVVVPEEAVKGDAAVAESMNIGKAISQGKKERANYVIFGSVTVVQNRLSTDAIVADVSQKNPVIVFSEFGKDYSDFFDHINLFAQQINKEISRYQ